jgi:hypothetical protein
MPKLKNGLIPQVLATEYSSYRDEVIDVLSTKMADAEESRSHPLVVYDPMAGTAPLLSLAERRGYTVYFNDLNPLHLYVNAAKTLPSYLTFKKIGPAKLLSLVCEMASGLDRCPRTPTEEWIESPVLDRLILAWKRSEEQNNSIATLVKAILLLAIRNFSSFAKTMNPTWLKPGGLRPKISAEKAFRFAIERIDAFYQHAYTKHSEIKGGRIVLTDHDASRRAPGCKVDAVMTSPPFCNRVDWDRIYAPEHFFLEAVGVWNTKTQFLGTTAVRLYPDFDLEVKFVTERSEYLTQFLREVKKRQIRSERRSDYYVKYFTRYFAGLFRVFDMSASVLAKDNTGIYFVVQDNTHRGLPIQIGQALAESLSKQGFHVDRLEPSWDRHHLGLRNISKRYRLVTPKQRESIWHAFR